jgi:hypothetical protein
MNAAHEIVGTTGEPHGPDTPWQTRIDLAWRLADKLTHGTLRPGALNGIGVGVVGPVGTPGQGPLWAPRHDIVAARVRERFGAPALIDNNPVWPPWPRRSGVPPRVNRTCCTCGCRTASAADS